MRLHVLDMFSEKDIIFVVVKTAKITYAVGNELKDKSMILFGSCNICFINLHLHSNLFRIYKQITLYDQMFTLKT